MQLDTNVCYRALRSRDARFDGKFFVAVAKTGIYGRPVCPARTPNREPDAFLASDLAVRRALSHGDPLISVAATEQRAEAWRPWRAYAVMHLWNRSGEQQ